MGSPLLADDVSMFPPTLVLTAEHDALAKGGELCARKLSGVGVECRPIAYAGALHGSAFLTGSWPSARK